MKMRLPWASISGYPEIMHGRLSDLRIKIGFESVGRKNYLRWKHDPEFIYIFAADLKIII
jgi:hypothetical protein